MNNNVEVKIIADSVLSKDAYVLSNGLNLYMVPDSKTRITTFQLRYPRIVHSELMTHRQFSRNAGSSRAKPVSKVLKDDVFFPVSFKSNKSGMQPGEELDHDGQIYAKELWEKAYQHAAYYSKRLKEIGVHKQWANRILEPFNFIDVVVTATDFENFFKLRIDDQAQDEIRYLAEEMKSALDRNKPNILKFHEWHLPYINDDDRENYSVEDLKRLSVARAARVSYKPFDMNNNSKKEEIREKDLELSHKLESSEHWSPFEHVATPLGTDNYTCGNLRGWKSFRSCLQDSPIMVSLDDPYASLMNNR